MSYATSAREIPASAAPAASRAPMISIRGLSKSYGGHKANDNISLDIFPNEVVALVGDNGAGKSTFIKMISGVVRPTSGSISIGSQSVELTSPKVARHHGIETLHQNLSLVDVFNVQENIFMGRELQRRILGMIPSLDHSEMRRRTVDLFKQLGLRTPDLNKAVRALSGGQRQAVGIARLLLESDLKLIIMDEPMAALGVEESRLVIELITRLRDRGYTVLIISHNLEHVFQVADRIAVMKNGRMIGAVERSKVEHDDVVSMIVGGRMPEKIAS